MKIKAFFKNIQNYLSPKIRKGLFSYDFIMGLDEKDYPKYLTKIYKHVFNKDLDFNNVKTFNEKIQWLKLFDCTPLKTKLTDKVLVRNWVKEQIGEEWLKPCLQICDKYDDINFDKLPNSFVIKANNGCKWHCIIKNKRIFLSSPSLFKKVRSNFEKWKTLNYMPFGDFELQYKDIKYKIIVEPFLTDEKESFLIEYEIYCFNGVPKIYHRAQYSEIPVTCVYNEDFSIADFKINAAYKMSSIPPSENLKQAVKLSKILAKEFKFVRVDWVCCNNKIYFNEMTFSPFSGFCFFEDEKVNQYMGDLLDLKINQ